MTTPKRTVGILIFDDRGSKADKHRIYSDNARKLLGTIYLPNGVLYVDANKPIADQSAYTVIVARPSQPREGSHRRDAGREKKS